MEELLKFFLSENLVMSFRRHRYVIPVLVGLAYAIFETILYLQGGTDLSIRIPGFLFHTATGVSLALVIDRSDRVRFATLGMNTVYHFISNYVQLM